MGSNWLNKWGTELWVNCCWTKWTEWNQWKQEPTELNMKVICGVTNPPGTHCIQYFLDTFFPHVQELWMSSLHGFCVESGVRRPGPLKDFAQFEAKHTSVVSHQSLVVTLHTNIDINWLQQSNCDRTCSTQKSQY